MCETESDTGHGNTRDGAAKRLAPGTQGKTALETLLARLTDKDKPVKVLRFASHIILRSRLTLFVNRLTNVAAFSVGSQLIC
jgi:hypothetical protein